MQLLFEIRSSLVANDEVIYGLYLVQASDGAEPTTIACLQDGYVTAEQAALALAECLTYAAPPPPDLSGLEAAAEAVSGLATGAEEMADAIRILGERMNTVEDRLDTKLVPQASGGRSLLPGRQVAAQHQDEIEQRPRRPGPPPIRRTKDLPEAEQNLAGRVHGQGYFGGPSRRGRGQQE